MLKKPLIYVLCLTMVLSCNSDEDEISSEAVTMSQDDAEEDAVSDELDDFARIAFNSEQSFGGRVKAINDHRLACEGTSVTVSELSEDKSSGTVTIDFGPDGCTDNNGVTRKGKLVVEWSGGKWYQAGSCRDTSQGRRARRTWYCRTRHRAAISF